MRLIIPPGESETRPPSRFMAINARDIWLSVQQLLLLFCFFFGLSSEKEQDAG